MGGVVIDDLIDNVTQIREASQKLADKRTILMIVVNGFPKRIVDIEELDGEQFCVTYRVSGGVYEFVEGRVGALKIYHLSPATVAQRVWWLMD
jgi:hypothetical protein